MNNKGCMCQACGCNYKVDIMVPDEVWQKIKPLGANNGSGLLCGSCIVLKLEDGHYGYWFLNNERNHH